MNCSKKSRACGKFVSAPSLRQLNDPILYGAGNLPLARLPRVLMLMQGRALQNVCAVALDDSHSRVHRTITSAEYPCNCDLDVKDFALLRFSRNPKWCEPKITQ
jgi:hypothetical protein